ncbi:MAG: acyltransferase family protein [Lachnospiraceae bacterium]|nr:acyltransferase family protein [Lachnospiraceae bacterium]
MSCLQAAERQAGKMEKKTDIKEKQGRKSDIEIWRIFFCLVVLGFHISAKTEWPYFHIGYLGVEFFFLLSGLGVYQSCLKREETKDQPDAGSKLSYFLRYAKKKFLRLYPLYFLSLIAMLIIRMITLPMGFQQALLCLKNCLAEFLMLQCSPIGGEVLISANWYVAVLFWGSLFYVAVYLLFGRKVLVLSGLAAAVNLYAYYFRLIGKIDVIFSYHAFLRALAGLGLGIFLGGVSGFFCSRGGAKTSFRGMAGGLFFVVFPNLILMAIVIYTNLGHRSKLDFLVITLFFASLLLLLCGPDICPERLLPAVKKLSGLTYFIYLFQMPVIELLIFLLS